MLPESVAALPMFVELVVGYPVADASPSGSGSGLKIIVGEVVIRASAGADVSYPPKIRQ